MPTVATAIVPSGTAYDYKEYQSAVNSRVLGDAIEKEGQAEGEAATGPAGAGRPNAACGQSGLTSEGTWSMILGMGIAVGLVAARL